MLAEQIEIGRVDMMRVEKSLAPCAVTGPMFSQSLEAVAVECDGAFSERTPGSYPLVIHDQGEENCSERRRPKGRCAARETAPGQYQEGGRNHQAHHADA